MLEEIERAFDGVPSPGPDQRTLFQAEAWDGYRVVDQRRDHLGRWQELSPEAILQCPNALPHLDEAGVRYYLPAILSLMLRSTRARRSWLHASLHFFLEPGEGELKDDQRKKLALLDPRQRSAILSFLEWSDEATESALSAWRRVVEGGDDPSWFRSFDA